MNYKLCTKCQVVKPVNQKHYYRNKQTKSGFASYCKVCMKFLIKKYYAAYPERANNSSKRWRDNNLGYYQKYYKNNALKRALNTRRYRVKNIEKAKARDKINTLIKLKKIIKESCQYLNGQCRGRLEAHHENYNNPLNVKWFCSKHHALADKVGRLVFKLNI